MRKHCYCWLDVGKACGFKTDAADAAEEVVSEEQSGGSSSQESTDNKTMSFKGFGRKLTLKELNSLPPEDRKIYLVM